METDLEWAGWGLAAETDSEVAAMGWAAEEEEGAEKQTCQTPAARTD